eukprot:XP_003728654.1 PREDICTED: repulsive guidance molecule A isoform X2 [Strongylocentrotus purpuratus]
MGAHRATRLADTCATASTPAAHTWKGMGRRRTAICSTSILQSASLAALLLQIAIFTALISKVYSACDILWCSYQYEADTDPLDPGPYPDFCRALQRYQRCVDRISPGSCRGDLHYHSTKTVIPDLQRNYECERVLREENNPGPTRAVETTTRPSRNGGDNDSDSPGTNGRPPFFPDILSDAPETGGSQRCQYTGSRSFRHCGLFGDPHLRTFDDLFQTCKVAGAWPLIYNDYLTAQVTNVPLVHGSGATATNKLTVIIKPFRDGECAQRKLYQATAGNLPTTFDDGTITSGREEGVVIIEVIPGEHVEIHIRYIATLIVIRQVGRYITFAVRMPEELIQYQGAEDMQLCVKGCPVSEQIDYATFLSQTTRADRNYKELRVDAIAKCRKAKIYDEYLDSCVFDLLTTGDANFTQAAKSALTDVNRLHPNASFLFKNRTSVFENASFPGYRDIEGGAPPRTYLFHHLQFNLAMVLFSILISSYMSSWCHIQR